MTQCTLGYSNCLTSVQLLESYFFVTLCGDNHDSIVRVLNRNVDIVHVRDHLGSERLRWPPGMDFSIRE